MCAALEYEYEYEGPGEGDREKGGEEGIIEGSSGEGSSTRASEGTVASANPGGGGAVVAGVLGWNVARRMLADVFEAALELDAASEEKEKEKEKGAFENPRPGRRDEGRFRREGPSGRFARVRRRRRRRRVDGDGAPRDRRRARRGYPKSVDAPRRGVDRRGPRGRGRRGRVPTGGSRRSRFRVPNSIPSPPWWDLRRRLASAVRRVVARARGPRAPGPRVRRERRVGRRVRGGGAARRVPPDARDVRGGARGRRRRGRRGSRGG